MKSRLISLLLALIFGTTFVSACISSGGPSSNESSRQRVTTRTTQSVETSTMSTTAETEDSTSEATETEPAQEKLGIVDLSLSEFDELLAQQPLYVSKTNFIAADEKLSSLYPNRLQAVVTNNTDEDIMHAVVAYVAWDASDLPVKIKGEFDFQGGSYVKEVKYADMNLVGGQSYGEDRSYSLSGGDNIESFKAVVVSFETFDGDVWVNPYYEDFCELYEGKRYSGDVQITLELADASFTPSGNASSSGDQAPDANEEVLSIEAFDELLADLPLYVSRTEYLEGDEQFSSLYPDRLSAVITNNSEADIKNATVALVAWDANGLPVKIDGDMSFTSATYIKEVNYSDINLTSGNSYGEDRGYSISNDNIVSFKAIAITFETFEGERWDNPYYDAFKAVYEGQRSAEDAEVYVTRVEGDFTPRGENSNSSSDINPAELDAKLAEQPVVILRTEYVVQDEQYKSLYPDMLTAVLQNNSTDDIKDAEIAFVAWDSNQLPVKIEGRFDFGSGEYFREVSYGDINLVPGASYGEDSGFSLGSSLDIQTVKAIVLSYVTFEGERWENPYVEAFRTLYEGKKLN